MKALRYLCYPEQALSPSGGKVLRFSLLSSVLEETVWSALTWPALLTIQLNLVSLYATFLPNFTSHTCFPLVWSLSCQPFHSTAHAVRRLPFRRSLLTLLCAFQFEVTVALERMFIGLWNIVSPCVSHLVVSGTQ